MWDNKIKSSLIFEKKSIFVTISDDIGKMLCYGDVESPHDTSLGSWGFWVVMVHILSDYGKHGALE